MVDPQLRLRVADASVFPLQPGVIPGLTIAMLAGRRVAWMLED